MKRFAVITLVFLTLILSGCKQTGRPKDAKKLSVVCTIFPQYDWARRIIGNADNIELTLLLNGKADLHNYQPSAADIVRISNSDLFIYVGGESDQWVDAVLKKAANPKMIVINLLDTLGAAVKIEEALEGMEAEEEAEEGGPEYDEHIWLSLRNAQTFCAAIAGALAKLDTANAEKYKNNLTAYTEKLSALDQEYQAAVKAAPGKTLLFGDRFPFRYLADDYGLTCYAAFSGCSAETEASFAAIVFLAKKTDELKLNTILVTESSDRSIAKTIIRNTQAKNQQILTLDSMQSVTARDVHNGATYLAIMTGNLKVLKDALK